MNQEETESALNFLNSLKWPKEQSGYVMSNESNLPPYRILSKMLREKKIMQQMTWNKAQCIEALGGIENVQDNIKNTQSIISENLAATLINELMTQKEFTDEIMQLTQDDSGTLMHIIQNEESCHIEQQENMFS